MSAAEQLCLDVGVERVSASGKVGLIGAKLCACGGDARAAGCALMADADCLRDQLATAACLVSRGYARGWRPKYERL